MRAISRESGTLHRVVVGLVELVGEEGGHAVAGLEHGQLDLHAVANDHDHGHGLANRTPEAKHGGTNDSARGGG